MNKVKIHECPYCQEVCIKLIKEKEIEPFNLCTHCNKTFPEYIPYISERRLEKRKAIEKHNQKGKQNKIIETYLDLAEVIQNAGGAISVINNHRNKPLSEFLENICSTNNIRFRHDKNNS